MGDEPGARAGDPIVGCARQPVDPASTQEHRTLKVTENLDEFPNRLSFSQRYGYEPLPAPMHLQELSTDLRTEIWNTIRSLMLQGRQYIVSGYYFTGSYRRFIERVLAPIHKIPHDAIETGYGAAMDQFKAIVFNGELYEVLDLIEHIANDQSADEPDRGKLTRFTMEIRLLFDRHVAGYFLDTVATPYQFSPRSNKEQGAAISRAIDQLHRNNMDGAASHLRGAARHIRKQECGDSIADSIHAVESVARSIDPRASRSLGSALDSLEKAGLLKHPTLKQAFSKLYGYTSDEQGIRHALLDRTSPDVGLDEAMFMFGAGASFAAYLVTKNRRTP